MNEDNDNPLLGIQSFHNYENENKIAIFGDKNDAIQTE